MRVCEIAQGFIVQCESKEEVRKVRWLLTNLSSAPIAKLADALVRGEPRVEAKEPCEILLFGYAAEPAMQWTKGGAG